MRQGGGRRSFRAVALAIGVLLIAAPAAGAAKPSSYFHAHRGGAYVLGVPTYPENTMPGFIHSASQGFVLELDVKLTADRVPVVIHDDSLDRTTNCSGLVKSRLAVDILANCRADVLGVPGSGLPTAPVADPTVPIPTLAGFLAFAKAVGATINLEIKNLPTDKDFDLTPAFANRVMDVLIASGIPQSHVIVQSFWPPNLQVAKARWPGVQTSLLTQSQLNVLGPLVAKLLGYNWVSPAWPLGVPLYVQLSHLLGLKVVPYTVDQPGDMLAAAAQGIDAIITNDPTLARATIP